MPATLHLTNAYHATSGGIRTFYRALLDGAEARDRVIHLVVPSEREGTESVGRRGHIHYVEARPAPGFDRRSRLITPFHYALRAAPIRRLIARTRPDVVEICDKYPLAPLAWQLRTAATPRPTLVGFSAERMDDNVAAWVSARGLARQASRRYMPHVYVPPFDVHLANSAYTADELASCGARAVHVCGMGVDVTTFSRATHDPSLRASLLAAAGGQPTSTLWLYAGRMSPEKHIDLAIDAVAQVAAAPPTPTGDPRLVLVGDGPAVEALRDRAERCCPGRVWFRPHVEDRLQLAQHYAAADVFVHPNPHEPFGIGPLEAMAAGVPVVVPRAGGVLTYADDANAWLAEPGAAGLARAVVAATTDPGRDARVDRARRTATAHDWSFVVDRYFRLIDGVHAERSMGSAPAGAPIPAPSS